MDILKQNLTIAFVPGTGKMGFALARNHAKAGANVVVGSRSVEKAKAAADKISAELNAPVTGLTNEEAAAAGDIIFWCIQGSIDERKKLLHDLAPQLKGKIIVDITNVLYLLDESHVGQTSSTIINQSELGVPARWTSAWKHTFQGLLDNPPSPDNPHHVFVCGDDQEAVATTIALVNLTPGFKGVNGGSLKWSKCAEVLGPSWIMELDRLNGGSYNTGWRFGS